MTSYGKQMLNAALKKMAVVKPIRLRPPSVEVKCHNKVQDWLTSCVAPVEEEKENEPFECSDEKSECVSESTVSKCSKVFPALQVLPDIDFEVVRPVNQSDHSLVSSVECTTDDTTEMEAVATPSPSQRRRAFEQVLPNSDFEVVRPVNQSDRSLVPLVEYTTADTTEMEAVTTPSPSQIRRAFEKVTVAGDPKFGNKRNYSKPDYCLFCKGMYISKISCHYLSVHTKESKVKDIMALPNGSKDRKRLLTLLQNEGNHLHNCEVLRNGFGEITVNRRPSDRDASRPEMYVPCSECKAWIFQRSLSAHSNSCSAGKSLDKNLLRSSRMLISPFISLDSDEAEIEDLIMKMKETSKHPGLKTLCMRDVLIKEFCRGLLHKLGSIDEQRRKDKDNIRTKLRTVGRLLIMLNGKSKQDFELMRYITPKYFMLIVNTVKEMGKHSPNLALTLGHYIKQICQLKQSLALQKDDEEAKRDSNNFNLLLGAHLNNYVSAVVLRRQKLRTLNKSVDLPKTSDMVKLKEFLDSEISKSLMKHKLTPQEWFDFAQALMVRVLLFNKRRVSEVEEMKVSDIIQVQNSSDNAEILSQMDITEKALANRMTAIEVRGKSTRGLRKVFVILSEQMLEACQHLIKTRLYFGIEPSNEYLFARPCGSALDGCKAMRMVTSRCPDLECPALIRTRLLRKYLATTIQLLDMTGDELKMVADHMGHSVAVHTDIYRLQTSLLEKTKVARALIALENGQLNKFSGRHLAACSFEELPIPLEIDDEVDTQDVTTGLSKDSVSSVDCDKEDSPITVEEEGKGRKRSWTDIDNGNKKIMKTRKRWDKNEEASLLTQFKGHIIAKRNPSNSEIRQAQEEYPCLKERSIACIKSKVNNIILGKCKGGLQ